MIASATALVLSAWLASIPGQAEDQTLSEAITQRKPVTCTDAAGIIYDRGTPGFERCLQEMNQAAQAEPEQKVVGNGGRNESSEQAGRSSPSRSRAPRPTNTPTTTPTVAPEARGAE